MKRLWLTAAIIICAVTVFTSCSNDDKPAGQKGENAGVPLIILDADIGSSTDDLFALEMLYRYEDEGRCHLLSVMVDREGEQNAAFADMMNTYFGHADTPIGFIRDGIKEPKVWIDYAHVADTKDGEGQPMFSQSIVDYSSLPDGWQLYRRLLAAQPDRSVSIVSVGFVTCLAQLLASGVDEYSSLSGVELVRRKVKSIYLQGGVFGEAVEPDFNFRASRSPRPSSRTGHRRSIWCSRRWRQDRTWNIRQSRSSPMSRGLTHIPSSKSICSATAIRDSVCGM